MWCFCRNRSSAIEDEQDEEFIRIVCDNNNAETSAAVSPASEIPERHRWAASEEDGGSLARNRSRNGSLKGDGTTELNNKDYENADICNKLLTNQGDVHEGVKKNVGHKRQTSSDAKKKMKYYKAEVHCSSKAENQSEGNKDNLGNNELCKKIKNRTTSDSNKALFLSHSTQTENGVLPAPLMKRREKAKSSELTENPNPLRSSNIPLDLSSKFILDSLDVQEPTKVVPKREDSAKPVTGSSYHYENLPIEQRNIIDNVEHCWVESLVPLDLSSGSSGRSKEGAGCNKPVISNLELRPLNLSNKNVLPAVAAISPSSSGRLYNGELSPLSMETNNTQCFSTASSRPDLLSNVDNEDYSHSKIGYFNEVYEKSLPNNLSLHAAAVAVERSSGAGSKVLSPSSLQNTAYYGYHGSESMEAIRPQVAHSGGHAQQNIAHRRHQCNSPDQYPPPACWQHSNRSHCPSRILSDQLRPQAAHSHQRGDGSFGSSLHSISTQSTKGSYYNPSYQNSTLSGETAYAVLDDMQRKPLYDNLVPEEDAVYQLYDKSIGSPVGPVYANASQNVENVYFAYDNNTYIPPRRLIKRENAYENDDDSGAQVDHTYSTIGALGLVGSKPLTDDSSPLNVTNLETDEAKEVKQNINKAEESCLKNEQSTSDPMPVALNLVKGPEILLPIKVKAPSNGRGFLKHSKNNINNGGRNGKLNHSSNKSSNKFSNKFKGKVRDIVLVEMSGTIMDDLLFSEKHSQTPQPTQKNKKPSLTSLASDQQTTPEKIGPPLGVCGKKFSSLSDMKKNSASPTSASNTPKSKGTRTGFLSSFSFRGEKKPCLSKKSESTKLLGNQNKWSNSSAASLGSIASLASSSSSMSNYVHPPSVASEGGLLSNYREEFECEIQPPHSAPPCLAANGNDSIVVGNFRLLRECPWYWGGLDVRRAEELMSGREDGSFLVRDSSDERCIVSLTFRSLQTTHHTRIEYRNGSLSFHIPSSLPNATQAPPPSSSSLSSSSPPPSPTSRSNIVEFIAKAIDDSVQNYDNLSSDGNSCWLFLERPGPVGVARVPVKLFLPISNRYPNKERILTLKQLARKLIISIVKRESINGLPVSHWLKAYLLIEYISEGPIEST